MAASAPREQGMLATCQWAGASPWSSARTSALRRPRDGSTEKERRGSVSPTPSAFRKASLHVQIRKNMRCRSRSGVLRNSAASSGARFFRAISAIRRTVRIFSMSMPRRPSAATPIMTRSDEWDWLNAGPPVRNGLPCSPYRKRTRAGCMPRSSPRVRRRCACATVYRRRWRAYTNRSARAFSRGDNSARAAPSMVASTSSRPSQT